MHDDDRPGLADHHEEEGAVQLNPSGGERLVAGEALMAVLPITVDTAGEANSVRQWLQGKKAS